MGITRFPHGVSSFGAVLTGQWAGLPRAGATKGLHLWVDGTSGGDGNRGESPDEAVATIGQAVTLAPDGFPTICHVFPGQYAETLDITKRNFTIVGETDGHTGIVQIIGDGTTARATIRVTSAFLRGFGLYNIELDTNGLAQPCLHLQTNDIGAATATSSHYRFRVEGVAVRSSDPRIGIQLQGASLGLVRRCVIMGPAIGLAFTGSANNNPVDLKFEDIDFMDCVTADIATVDDLNSTTIARGATWTNIQFERMKHWDRGGTPVTNYVNLAAGTYVNSHFFDCYAARDVADDTLLLLPAGVVWQGYSAASAEFIIGA